MISKPRFDAVFPFAEGLARVKIGKHWGFLGTDGTLTIEPSFANVSDFSCGLACVVSHRGIISVVDRSGKIRFETNNSPSDFSEGLARVGGENGGFVDPSGKLVIKSESTLPFRDFHEGLAAIGKEGRFGFIDSRGKVVIPPRFADVLDFSEGRAAFSLKPMKWTAEIIDLTQ